jgi:adenosylmethionine-8-amino-7-oxononanoate aminotransferase
MSIMSALFQRNLHANLPNVVKGKGNYLIDETGKKYLDACGGAAVSCLGHDCAPVISAIKQQVDKLCFAHTGYFSNEPAEKLAFWLVDHAPAGTGAGSIMLLGSGSEAMEAALKLARQYHLENGEQDRSKVIARKPSYHGNTLGALATGYHEGRRAPYAPLLRETHYIDVPYRYRMMREDETEAEFATRLAQQLEDKIGELGTKNVMAFVLEPVVGATLGCVTSPKAYFKTIREICDKHGVLIIADEVMCGMGRTGTTYALEQEGIAADITTLAKGLGAGYQPIAAVLTAKKIMSVISQGSGKLWNGHTYMSHAVAAAAALAVQEYIESENLHDNIRVRGRQLEGCLQSAFSTHPHVGDIRGRGLFWSIELVEDKASKKPYAATDQIAIKIGAAALENGMMCYPTQGCANGIDGDHVLLAPSYTSSADEITTIVELLERAVSVVVGD